MNKLDPERDWKALLAALPGDYEQLAHELRLVNSQWRNAKVKSAEELLRFILLHVGADLPLRQTVAIIANSGGPDVTQVWLHKKMRKAQVYLAALVERMLSLSDKQGATPERWAGYEVLCLDGSSVCGPGSEGTDARLHAVLRLHDLRVCDVHVTGRAEGETLRRFCWKPGQLVIVDRGYSNAPGIAWVVESGADVLVRVNRGALPLFDNSGDPIDVPKWCRGLKGQQTTDRWVHIEHRIGKRSARSLRGRLIGFRLPKKEAAKARQRVRKEQGRKVTQDQLTMAEYVVLFTTVPTERLSAARCTQLYRLRWQVELLFKRWKSLCHFDRLPNYIDDTIVAWLTTKVLLGLILDRVGASGLLQPAAHTSRAMARQPWKVTTVLWPLLVAALFPMRLADAPAELPAITERLDRMDALAKPRQVQALRAKFFPSNDNGLVRGVALTRNC